MEKTPKNKLKLSRRQEIIENSNDCTVSQIRAHNCVSSTPIKESKADESDDGSSIVGTQKDNEDIDVVWDWNSPQANKKQGQKRKQKRLMLSQSPKYAPKRRTTDQMQDFEKLKEELQALRNQLSKQDEECYPLSPLEEEDFKNIGNNPFNSSAIPDLIENNDHNFDGDLEDIFNDSVDEQLMLCTQQIEQKIEQEKTSVRNDVKPECIINANLTHDPGRVDGAQNITNDSLDALLGNLEVENCHFRSKYVKSETLFKRTTSNMELKYHKGEYVNSSNKFEFHRTRSFEIAAVSTQEIQLPKNVLDEIERKRQEAIAKREAKRKMNCETIFNNNVSPVKCSPDEIEQKRLKALAKLEAKKREMIEKNRQEALKRLERSKAKRTLEIRNPVM